MTTATGGAGEPPRRQGSALAVPSRPSWQAVIDALRAAGSEAEARYMEDLRAAAKNPRVSATGLVKMIGKL